MQTKVDYTKVESLLFKGFLHARVTLGKVPIVFKTLNQVEYDLILIQGNDLEEDWRVHSAYYLAYSTLFFNRASVLPERSQMIPHLADFYEKLPEYLLVNLLLVINRLNKESREELAKIQAYSFGDRSREYWMQYRGTPLSDPRLNGIEGMEITGLNYHQKLWTYLNRVEDQQQSYLDDYALAKFMVSPHAPKEIQKRDQKDRKRLAELQKFKKKTHEGRKAAFGDGENQVKFSAESAEELLAQMEQSLRGEKDYHDLVIEEHKRKVRQRYLAREAERARQARIAAERRERMLERNDSAIPLEGLSPEEVDHLTAQQRGQEREMRSQRDWVDPQALAEQEKNLLRWGFIEPDDVPQGRRDWYDPRAHTEQTPREPTQNPLIEEHYERVIDDLDT